ncbi:hypothetical protein F5879DRAFT_486712 [Lentinula edodes]|nr:hypothetical protein F5879DRAFT_486712 [Lentinula edodes]
MQHLISRKRSQCPSFPLILFHLSRRARFCFATCIQWNSVFGPFGYTSLYFTVLSFLLQSWLLLFVLPYAIYTPKSLNSFSSLVTLTWVAPDYVESCRICRIFVCLKLYVLLFTRGTYCTDCRVAVRKFVASILYHCLLVYAAAPIKGPARHSQKLSSTV